MNIDFSKAQAMSTLQSAVDSLKQLIHIDDSREQASTLKELQTELFTLGVSKGWWPKDLNPLEFHALVHAEVSEATEEVRDRTPAWYMDESQKPQGEMIELADVVIMIMGYFEYRGWDLHFAIKKKHQFNKTRPPRTERTS